MRSCAPIFAVARFSGNRAHEREAEGLLERNFSEGARRPGMVREPKKGLRPIAILPIGFFAMIALGTLLLLLPISTVNEPLSLVEALFTATSGICVTGLTVINPGTELTHFGQAVLLILIQIGGLGFMSVATMLFMFVGKKVSLHDRMTIAESFGQDRLQGAIKLCLMAVKLTFCIELLGALLLLPAFVPEFGGAEGCWVAVFTSVSAFCNAGFDVFGASAPQFLSANQPYVLIVIMLLIILGGLGFAVLGEILARGHKKRFSLHAKLVLSTTGILILAGAAVIFALEFGTGNAFGGLNPAQGALSSLFQSVTARTAGFDAAIQSNLSQSTRLVTMALMFIGASPAGTGGGIKTVTLAVLALRTVAIVRNRQSLNVFGRKINEDITRRAFCVLLLAVSLVFVMTVCICAVESSTPMPDILFEVISAMSTTGLSTGITKGLSGMSHILLCATMYAGRVGLLTLAVVLGGSNKDRAIIKYPAEDIFVG